MKKILKNNECIYRDIWIDRCNDYNFSNSYTDFHLVIPVDEILTRAAAFERVLHSQTIEKEKHVRRQQEQQSSRKIWS